MFPILNFIVIAVNLFDQRTKRKYFRYRGERERVSLLGKKGTVTKYEFILFYTHQENYIENFIHPFFFAYLTCNVNKAFSNLL